MIPPPKKSILDNFERLGAPHGRKRWKDPNTGRLFEWDSMHGEIEVYNSRGYHIEVVDKSGDRVKGPVKGRTIDV